ncbi:Hypothetical protein I5071_89710 [Sandaracinus amylolyticus]|nr:Hypothetical protein I5071_89710 [Sandaracinus amylolyticus]
MQHDRSRLVSLALVALALSLAGCGASYFRAPFRNAAGAPSDDERRERLALGAIDPDLATDPPSEVARLRRIAALEARLGNHGLAIEATLRALQVARANATLAPEAERDRARRLHVEVRDEALAYAERTGSLELALEAVGRGDPGRARDLIARLVWVRADAGGSLEGLVLADPLVRALDDAARLDFERLGAELPGEPLPIDRIARFGSRALPALARRLREAARRDDAAQVQALARAIREIDRWDPMARAIVHLAEAGHAELAVDVVGSADAAGHGLAVARLERARRADPDDASIAIGLALHCLGLRLHGDALELARDALPHARNDDERKTATLIAGLASTIDGDGGAIADWELEHDREHRSIAVARAIAPLRSMPGVSEALRDRARWAARTLVAAGVATPTLVLEVALDGDAPNELRERAIDALWTVDRGAARVAAQCAAQRTEREACEARLVVLSEDAWRGGLTPEGEVPDLDEASLPAIELAVDDARLGATAEWIESASRSRLSLAPRWVRARIVLAARQGDVGGARMQLESDGALLTGATRIALAAWLDDLSAGREVALSDLAEALALGPALTRFGTPPVDAPRVTAPSITGDTDRLVAADRHLAYDTWRAAAPAALRVLLERAADHDGAVIAGWMGAAIERDARERGASASELAQVAERAQALAPGSAVALLLDALRRRAEGDPGAARDTLARALVLAPTAPMLQRRWIEAWGEAEPDAPAERARAVLLAIDPLGLSPALVSEQAAQVADLADLYGAPTRDGYLEFVARGGPRIARVPGAWEAIEAALRHRIAQGPGEEAPSASAMLALVESSPASPSRRRWLVRLRVLVGDGEGALAAADAGASTRARVRDDRPLAPHDRLRALARARGAIDERLAWRLVAADALDRQEPDVLARLRTLAEHHPELDALACSEHARLLGHTAALPTCLRAWRRGHDPVVAALLADAVTEVPRAARAAGLEPEAFFAEARDAMGDALPGAVLHREAVFRAQRGERDEAIAAELEAQARGWLPDGWERDPTRRPPAGLLLRAQRARTAADQWQELAALALAEARVRAAKLYADAAVRAMEGAPAEQLERVYELRDLVGWAERDLADGHLDAAGVDTFERARRSGFAGEEIAALASEHPDSALAAYGAAVRAVRTGRRDEALRLAEVALRDVARPTMIAAIAGIADEEGLVAMRERARASVPDDPRIERESAAPPVVVASAPAATQEPVRAASDGDERCPLARELRAAGSAEARDALLRDAYVAASDAGERERILACAGTATASARATTEEPRVARAAPSERPTERAVAVSERAATADPDRAERATSAERTAEPAASRETVAPVEPAERTAPAQHAAAAERPERTAPAERAEPIERAAPTQRAASAESTAAAERAAAAASQELVEEAARRAVESERRAAEAERRRREAEARLAEAERRAAESERRALDARPRPAAADPDAIGEAEPDERAADAARRLAEAERRALEAEARAERAERAAMEEARRTVIAARAAAQIATARPEAAPPPRVAAAAEPPPPATPDAALAPVAPASEPPVDVIAVAPAAVAAVPPADDAADAGVAAPPVVAETAAATEPAAAPPTAESGIRVLAQLPPLPPPPVASSEAPPTPSAPPVAVVPPSDPSPDPDARQRAAAAEVAAAESERRAVEDTARLADAQERAALAEQRASASGELTSHADAQALAAERQVLEAEARAIEAERRAADAAHRAAAEALRTAEQTERVAEPTPASAASPEPQPQPSAQHGGLGLAALLDADPRAHRRGVALAMVDPEGALRAARDVLARPPATRAAELPYASVQVLVGLPQDARRTLADELMQRTDGPRLPLIALAAERIQPGTVDPALLGRAIQSGPTALAIEAVRAHDLRAPAAELDMMRSRLDAMQPSAEPLDGALVAALVHALAAAGDPQDRSRLERAPSLVAGAPVLLAAISRDVALHRAGSARGRVTDPEVERARRARRPSELSTAAITLLASEPLPRVLTGSYWRHARISQPAGFTAALRSGPLAPIATAAGNGSGVDLERPIECAIADSGERSWVCVAHVQDADRVRASLAEPASSAAAAARLPLDVAVLAGELAALAGPAPLVVDALLDAPGAGGTGEIVIAERARAEVDLGGVGIERYATVERRENGATDVRLTHVLFTGDRVVLFGDEEIARAVLSTPPRANRSLAGSSRLRRLERSWTAGPVLQLATLDWRSARELPLTARRDSTLEVRPEGGALVVTMRSPYREPRRDIVPLEGMLPEGAIARFALASHAARAPRRRPGAVQLPADRAALGRLVLRETEQIAFAWMPAAGEGAWDRWVAIGEGARIDGALAGAGLARGDANVREIGGGFAARRGARWIVGAREDDVRAALARPETTGDRASTERGSGAIDGDRAASVLADIARGVPETDARRGALDELARRVGRAHGVSYRARAEGRELVVELRAGAP